MNSIPAWLSSYGLNNTEIKIYLSILQYPNTKVSDIQRRTSLVRTTIYNSISNLKATGLISENLQNNVKTYRAADTKILEQNIEAEISAQKLKLQSLSILEPLFKKLQSAPEDNESYISRFEGVNSVKQAIEDAFRCNSKQWLVIASRDNFLYHTSKEYKKYYLNERLKRKIEAKTLWEPTGFNIDETDPFHRNPKHLPEIFKGTFNSLVIIYDDTTLIVDPYSQKSAHAIHNKSVTQLMTLMFNAIYSAS